MNRNLQKHLEMRQVLRLEELRIGDSDLFRCPFHHKDEEEAQIKWYKELNAVACINPSCSCYQQVYSPIEVLQKLGAANKRKAVLIAEELLIEELQDYRRTARHQAALLSELGGIGAEEKLSGAAWSFLQEVQNYVAPQEEEVVVFNQRELDKVLDMHPASIEYYLFKLEKLGYIESHGGDEQVGYKFELFRVPEEIE